MSSRELQGGLLEHFSYCCVPAKNCYVWLFLTEKPLRHMFFGLHLYEKCSIQIEIEMQSSLAPGRRRPERLCTRMLSKKRPDRVRACGEASARESGWRGRIRRAVQASSSFRADERGAARAHELMPRRLRCWCGRRRATWSMGWR